MINLRELSVLEIIALVFLVALAIYIVKFLLSVIYTYGIGPMINKVDFKSKGKWALVTGCTDGIGKEYARQLAARGCDIVLVSRSMDKLKATAEEIEKEYKVATKIVQVDFGGEEEIYDKISKEIADLEIGTLVNNVGVSYPYPEYFLDVPDCRNLVLTVLKANMLAMTRMTAIVLPDMVKRRKGVIINIGSTLAMIPSPLLTFYAASKAYADKFTEGINIEYSKKGVIIQSVMPGLVYTKLSGISGSSLFSPTAKVYVKSALASVGTTTRTTGYLPHAFTVGATNVLRPISESFVNWLCLRAMINVQQQTLKTYDRKP